MTVNINIKEIKISPKKNDNDNNKIYVRATSGLYQKLRRYTGWVLILLFMALPMLRWNNHQAVLFDLDKQQYHIFNLTLFPQDLTLLAWVFIIAAFSLFFFTTYLGRVWCGYTCPQTIWSFIFIWFEEHIEGSANQRKCLDKAPWSKNKFSKKIAKHSAWIIISLLTGLTFCSYFVLFPNIYIDFFTFNSSPTLTGCILFFASITYMNAGWMRSIVCTHMCPYARFQSAMFDENTYIVAYDEKRGEQRGPRRRKSNPSDLGLGDCIACELCVQVCPAGIDIREGLQYECINCGACIDACDTTMLKMNYPKGLISYTSETRLAGGESQILRPKIISYGVLLIAMLSIFSLNLFTLSTIELEIVRDRNTLYRENNEGLIENTYTLKILNKTIETQSYKISFSGLKDAYLIGPKEIVVQAGEIFTQPITIVVDAYAIKAKKVMITIRLNSKTEEIKQDSPFFISL
ncbi:cytochrome c oxidase accessory protein CcoG [Psychromonas sp. CD1]|uniref:cytochrome c oxidase accessory protein CcoG n=1 Tax=Psychromonas sp. CD1 TaxID=1979839 RepID=UPI000B9C291C|nr:cytochrome c oxidase accessory protein CcoG [Psychromonas sp. CD1]